MFRFENDNINLDYFCDVFWYFPFTQSLFISLTSLLRKLKVFFLPVIEFLPFTRRYHHIRSKNISSSSSQQSKMKTFKYTWTPIKHACWLQYILACSISSIISLLIYQYHRVLEPHCAHELRLQPKVSYHLLYNVNSSW